MNFSPIVVTAANKDFAISTNITNALRALSTKMRLIGGYPLSTLNAANHKIVMVGESDEDSAALTYLQLIRLYYTSHVTFDSTKITFDRTDLFWSFL